MSHRRTQALLFLVFTLSGATGLIYESVWSHYLKIFLGHAAYAQALVLVMFMGGMALGAWLISRLGVRLNNLLLAYATAEALIGIAGLVFHYVFTFLYDLSFENIIPSLGESAYIHLYKYTIASILILPQSILLGMTFPLMSGGFIRTFPDTPGRTISFLYFWNSIGAAAALIISTFYLIGKLGLPGTIAVAGIINILLALLVAAVIRDQDVSGVSESSAGEGKLSWYWLILAGSFFTGVASFIYEVAWIRMLSMVLGASTHSFELMLSAFITGIGIGGYWVRKKIDHLEDPIMFVSMVQILMGILALSTIFFYNYSFEVMSFFMAGLSESEQGYVLFNLAIHGIALIIMLPATICAGMTLPLFTFILLKNGHGEKSIGQVYASNTIGAISGVVFTVFIGMPYLALKGSIFTGAVIDISIGLILIIVLRGGFPSRRHVYAISIVLFCFVLASFTHQFDTKKMASGVFRQGEATLEADTEVLFHRDGKTASISVTDWDDKNISILTNGKSDASITIDEDLPPSSDESTMTLLAALPLSVNPEAKRIANIGIGSGMTTHVALNMPGVERVDTIEIEEAMVAGARFFRSKTENAFLDPRSHIHLEDARTYLSIHHEKYDIIISEPSNPWVSGIASLFTHEFYEIINRHLEDDGIFVQWVHIYEFNLDLLISVLKALSTSLPYYNIYFADDGNLLVLAGKDNPLPVPDPAIFDSDDMRAQLSTIHINNIEDIRFRFLGDQTLFDPFLGESEIPANSDYNSYLDLNATRARFMKEDVSYILDIRLSKVPILGLLYGPPWDRQYNLSVTQYYPSEKPAQAVRIYDYLSKRIFSESAIAEIANMNFLLSTASRCDIDINYEVWINSFYSILSQTVAYLTNAQLNEIINAITPTCDDISLPSGYQDWLLLYRSLVAGDYDGVLASTGNILRNGSYSNIQQKEFILTVMLTALIKAGHRDQAKSLWEAEIENIYEGREIPIELRLLISMAETFQ